MKTDVKRKLQKKWNSIDKTAMAIKLSLSIFFTTIFLIVFFTCGGTIYFSSIAYPDQFAGYDFQVHMLSVGQADCILLRFPNDQTMMIDTGSNESADDVIKYTKKFLKKEELSQIDYLLLTHPDADHTGGATEVLLNFEVNTVFRPKMLSQRELAQNPDSGFAASETQTYNNAIDTAHDKGCTLVFSESGISMNIGGCKIEFLSPEQDSFSDTNSYSAVVMATYQTKKFLFTGDAPIAIESQLIEKYGEQLKADFLKVGHHGSATSTNEAFLDIVSPKYAAISARENGDLPDVKVTNSLRNHGATIYSTANGNFAATVANDDIIFTYAPQPKLDIAIVISVYIILILLTWGINPSRQKKKVRIEMIDE